MALPAAVAVFSGFPAAASEIPAKASSLRRGVPGRPLVRHFDLFMWGRGSPEPVMALRTKEIKNGRLFLVFCFPAVYTPLRISWPTLPIPAIATFSRYADWKRIEDEFGFG